MRVTLDQAPQGQERSNQHHGFLVGGPINGILLQGGIEVDSQGKADSIGKIVNQFFR